MIPQSIVAYLDSHSVPFERHGHRRAVSAQELAASVHVPGRRVAKSVLVKAGDRVLIAVLPSTEIVDEGRLAAVVGTTEARLLREPEFERFFPDCEPGAEPPFGGLYGLPLVVDTALADEERLVFRGGSHEEAIEMAFDDFFRLENTPRIGTIGKPQRTTAEPWPDWPEPGI